MTYLNRLRISKIIFPIVSFLVLVSSFSFSRKPDTNKLKFSQTLSGEEIFKAVFFNSGEALRFLPSLNKTSRFDVNNLTKEEQLEKQQIMSDIIANIKQLHPEFFSRFNDAIRSDDYNKISDALNEASDVIIQAGIHSDKYGNYFKSAMNLVKDINVKDFNLNDPQGREKFKEYIRTKQQSSGPGTDETNGACIIALVVAVETLFFINSVAVSTVVAATIAVAVTVAVVKVATKHSMSGGIANREQIVVDLAYNF